MQIRNNFRKTFHPPHQAQIRCHLSSRLSHLPIKFHNFSPTMDRVHHRRRYRLYYVIIESHMFE